MAAPSRRRHGLRFNLVFASICCCSTSFRSTWSRICAVTDPVPAVLVIVRSKHRPPCGFLIPSTEGDHPHIRCTANPPKVSRTLPSSSSLLGLVLYDHSAHCKRGLLPHFILNSSLIYGTDPTVRRLTIVIIQSPPTQPHFERP